MYIYESGYKYKEILCSPYSLFVVMIVWLWFLVMLKSVGALLDRTLAYRVQCSRSIGSIYWILFSTKRTIWIETLLPLIFWEFYCLEKLSSKSCSKDCIFQEFWVTYTFSFIFFAFLFISPLLFIFLLSIYLFYLSFLHYADSFPVAIGIYPRGCVGRLLWLIIRFY